MILNEEPGALAQGLLVPEHREVSRDRGASQCHWLSSCFNQASWGLGDSSIHKACGERRLGLRKNTGERPMMAMVSGKVRLGTWIVSCAKDPPAARRQRATQQTGLQPMAG